MFQLKGLLYPILSYDALLKRFFQAQHSLQELKRFQLPVLKALESVFFVYPVTTIEEEEFLDRTRFLYRNPHIHLSFLDEKIDFFAP
jgi:hypothetical protein